MAMPAAISTPHSSLVLPLRAGQNRPARQLEIVAAPPAGRGGRRRWAARPAMAMGPPRNWECRGGPRGAAAMTEASSEKEIGGEARYEELAREMENASPLAIVDRALEMFGNDIAIAFRFVWTRIRELRKEEGGGSGSIFQVTGERKAGPPRPAAALAYSQNRRNKGLGRGFSLLAVTRTRLSPSRQQHPRKRSGLAPPSSGDKEGRERRLGRVGDGEVGLLLAACAKEIRREKDRLSMKSEMGETKRPVSGELTVKRALRRRGWPPPFFDQTPGGSSGGEKISLPFHDPEVAACRDLTGENHRGRKQFQQLSSLVPITQRQQKNIQKNGGNEDVALLEYARLTGRPFRVFSLDTGRLNPETYQFLDIVEKHYGIHIEFMFPDSAEVQALVRRKGLFSFYEDGHHECCMVRKVRPLRRALRGFNAWITGQRKDQLLGTASSIPIVQVDPSFVGLDGGEGSLIKWNPIANIDGKDIWNFLRAMEVPVNSLHSQGFVSIGCEPCTRPVLPNQHETEGSWWWEDAKTKECSLHSANSSQNNSQSHGNTINGVNDIPDIFETQTIVSLTRLGIMNLLKLERRKEPWLVVLYAPWCRFCQAMESSYIELAEKLNGLGVKVGKFRSDGDQKTFAKLQLQLGSFPTIIFFPKHASRPVKYPSKRRDADSLLAFVNAFR
ncbi:hypothetical protein KSP40_PGU018121 [Platanthera guangdongensis]|uniref:Thioredoxin domain-containing protein n=1 Tax=Platanthera guangdongensis TaxID=2320717 RepID=A0ABR2MIE4_9ASPA